MAREMSETEMREVKGGEAITLSGIMALLAVAIVTVVTYKIFRSESGKGKISLPGGFTFQW